MFFILVGQSRTGRCLWAKPGDSPHVSKTVNDYLITLYDDKKLSSEATIRKFRIVQTEGNRHVSRLVDHYRLEAILSVGYRVRFQRKVQFRRWATSQRQEHPCQREAILPIDSRPPPMVDEKTRGLSQGFVHRHRLGPRRGPAGAPLPLRLRGYPEQTRRRD